MKKLFIILIVLSITGCSVVTEDVIFNRLNEVFSTFEKKDIHTNTNTKYYSFYLPSDIQELDCDESYRHLVFNDSDFVMNLDVNSILCKEVFNTAPDNIFSSYKDYQIYQYDSNDDYEYIYTLYKVDNDYFFSLNTTNMSYFGKTCLQDADALAIHLLNMDSSINIDTDKVIDAYYIGSIIDVSNKEQVDFYPHHIESNGLLENLFIDK